MPNVHRVRVNILAKDVHQSVRFYERVLGMVEVEGYPWVKIMALPGERQFEIGLIDEVSEYVPRPARGIAEGTFLTLVVEDVVAAVEAAFALDVEVVEPPRGEGRLMRALVRDPNGVVIDIVTPEVSHYLEREAMASS